MIQCSPGSNTLLEGIKMILATEARASRLLKFVDMTFIRELDQSGFVTLYKSDLEDITMNRHVSLWVFWCALPLGGWCGEARRGLRAAYRV
jgi:hypothetical protein